MVFAVFVNGAELIKLREEKGLSQKQLAEQVGCSLRSIARAEQGEKLREAVIQKLATVFGVEPEELQREQVDRSSLRAKFTAYLRALRTQFRPVKIRGLGHYDEQGDIALDELFVKPYLSQSPIQPDDTPALWQDLPDIGKVLQQGKSIVVLGDPGSGKSTLVGHIVLQTAQEHPTTLSRVLEDRLPIPLVLRELQITTKSTLKEILTRFLERLEDPQIVVQDLFDWLRAGSAVVLLDGLDELLGLEVRQHLRQLVWDAMDQFEGVRWVCTSRIVGYEEATIDGSSINIEGLGRIGKTSIFKHAKSRAGDLSAENVLFLARMSRWFLAPFDDEQIRRFAEHWFVIRERNKRQGLEIAEKFLRAVQASPATQRLARIPNILTIMVILFRELQVLPENRALLYSKLVEAYLETIDRARGIAAQRHSSLTEQKLWLGRIAWEIQQRRTAVQVAKRAVEETLLASHVELVDWIRDECQLQGRRFDAEDVEQFLEYLQRRAGLLLERGVRAYAFAHLSFVEYFAAYYMVQGLPEWLLDVEAAPADEQRGQWTGDVRWHEVILFAFEEVQQQNLRMANRLREWLFHKLNPAKEEAREAGLAGIRQIRVEGPVAKRLSNRLILLTRLAENRATGWEAWKGTITEWCCAWGWIVQQGVDGDVIGRFVSRWINSGDTFETRQQMLALLVSRAPENCQSFSLSHCQVRDIDCLKDLPQLSGLCLVNLDIEDVTVLQGLKQLEVLQLSRLIVSDLSALRGLTKLHLLYLDGTAVSDISPLAGLAELRRLSLRGTAVSDVSPIKALTKLTYLDLSGSGVTDVSPLQKLVEKGLHIER